MKSICPVPLLDHPITREIEIQKSINVVCILIIGNKEFDVSPKYNELGLKVCLPITNEPR